MFFLYIYIHAYIYTYLYIHTYTYICKHTPGVFFIDSHCTLGSHMMCGNVVEKQKMDSSQRE